LIFQNKILKENFLSLQKSYDSILAGIDEQNKLFSKLNQYSVELHVDREVYVSKMIKEITGAKFSIPTSTFTAATFMRVYEPKVQNYESTKNN
jgi:hypothetical protein